MYKIMLVDDEDTLQQAIEHMLVSNGYQFFGARDVESAWGMLDQVQPDLLLLDVMLPGTNGFEFCDDMREAGYQIPVIFLSAKNDIVDKSIGFRVGADDYVTKPFDSAELLLRIDAIIRRYKNSDKTAWRNQRKGRVVIQDLEVRFDEYEIRVKGKPVPLTTKEFEIVALLAADAGKVFTRDQIQQHIWGEQGADCKPSNNITVFVHKIREKLEDNPSEPKYLLTVPRIGYKIADQ